MAEGLGGIELNHPDHDGAARRRVLGIAERYPLLVLTGGSDFHGAFGPPEPMGSVLAPEDSFPRITGGRSGESLQKPLSDLTDS